MRTVKAIVKINESPKCEIDNVGIVSQVCFAQKLYYSYNAITWKQVLNSSKISFTSEFMTEMINKYPGLYEPQF